MLYQKLPIFDKKETLKLLKSENESEQIKALLSIVEQSGNYDLSMEKSIEFAQKKPEWIKGCGIECFGHIARIHNKIELDIVIVIIKKGLNSNSKVVSSKSESAIDDIAHFLNLDRKLFE